MCNPVFAMLAVTAAGTMAQANAQKQAGAMNAQVAEQNAAVAKAQEQSAYDKGAVQETQYSNQLKQLQGRAIATAGANGIDPSRGTPLDLLVQSTGFGEKDIQQIRNNAAMEAFGYAAQATNFTNQGQLDVFEGEQQAQATYLTGAGSMLGSWARFYDSGPSKPPAPGAG